MATLHVDAPEPKLTLELSLNEAAVLWLVIGHAAGKSVEPTNIYTALSDNERVIERADNFKFTPGNGEQAMRVDPQ